MTWAKHRLLTACLGVHVAGTEGGHSLPLHLQGYTGEGHLGQENVLSQPYSEPKDRGSSPLGSPP